MIGGQVMDIEGGGSKPTAELVERIHRAKTGALITVSIVAGGLLGLPAFRGEMGIGGGAGLAGVDSIAAAKARFEALGVRAKAHHASNADTITRLRTFGEKAGLAFQIVDDILDMTQTSEELGKTAGKDTATDKATWPAVFGIPQSKHDAAELIADAFAALEPFGDAATPLKSLAQYLVDRTH
jgi:geranylgeranyl diphosphate synthase type II